MSIHSTLWEDPIEIVGINDVVLNKLNVKGKYVLKYDLTDYAIKYDSGGFWLYINDLEGYFEFEIFIQNKKDYTIEYGIKLLII